MLFFDIDNPSPEEIKIWMKKNDFTIDSGSSALGISKRQFARFLSGETNAKRVHSLAMQMVWLIYLILKDGSLHVLLEIWSLLSLVYSIMNLPCFQSHQL